MYEAALGQFGIEANTELIPVRAAAVEERE
jgi:hypothetical protein